VIARTPEPPYVAVIFTSLHPEGLDGYAEMADRMLLLAQAQPGYLGHESARQGDGWGITVSYWESEAAAQAWKADTEHREAQRLGRGRLSRPQSLPVAVAGGQGRLGGVPLGAWWP